MARKVVGHIELHWRCPNCNTQNPGSEKSCVSCGNPQPPDVAFYQLSDAKLLEDEEKIKAAKLGPDVHCPYCGTRNSADAKECIQCGGNLEDAQQRVRGNVLGAFGTDAGADQTELLCPACKQPNASDVEYCVHCGSPIHTHTEPAAPINNIKAAPAAPQAAAKSKKLSPVLLIVFILIALGCVGAIVLSLIFGGNGSEPVTATVSDVYWKISVDIEELQYVSQESWWNDVPDDAEEIRCEQELYRVQDVPAPNALEVCGTPYTVDLGNGNAEVVQDCEYQIYEDYCSFEMLDWVVIDTVIFDGNDNDPEWYSSTVNSDQVVGNVRESYQVRFYDDGKTYDYQPEDLYDFQLLQVGTTWELELGLFGQIKSISAVK